jgi:hypothetical protein
MTQASKAQLETARSLIIDRVTGEVVAALRDSGVPSVVLKGPVIARLLYDDGTSRPYGDSDLLVPETRLAEAESVLRRLGFRPSVTSEDFPSRPERHAAEWRREQDNSYVDIHWTLPGAGAPPDRVWDRVSSEAERSTIGGVEVLVSGEAGTALLLALHLASHGLVGTKAAADLERATARLPESAWRAADALAAEIDATAHFAAGLRLIERGRAIADRLGLPQPASVEFAIKAAEDPGSALGLESLVGAASWRERLRIFARALFPSRRYMPVWFRPARRGGLWLVAGYLWRPFWLARRTVPTLRTWRSARRVAGRDASGR